MFTTGAAGDLVHFIKEDDAILLDCLAGTGLDIIVVDQFRRLLVKQLPVRIFKAHFAPGGGASPPRFWNIP